MQIIRANYVKRDVLSAFPSWPKKEIHKSKSWERRVTTTDAAEPVHTYAHTHTRAHAHTVDHSEACKQQGIVPVLSVLHAVSTPHPHSYFTVSLSRRDVTRRPETGGRTTRFRFAKCSTVLLSYAPGNLRIGGVARHRRRRRLANGMLRGCRGGGGRLRWPNKL